MTLYTVGNTNLERYNGSSDWSTVNVYSLDTPSYKSVRLSSGAWLTYADSGSSNTGNLYRSADDGASWTEVLSHDPTTTRGVQGFDVAPNGYIYAVYSATGIVSGGKDTRPVLIKRSTDDGVTWSTVYTDTTAGALGTTTNANSRTASHNPLVCDKNDSNNVYCHLDYINGTFTRAIRTQNGGSSWSSLTGTFSGHPGGVGSADCAASGAPGGSGYARIFYTQSQGSPNVKIKYTDDMGDSWAFVPTGPTGSTPSLLLFFTPYEASHGNKLSLQARNSISGSSGRLWITNDNLNWFDSGTGDLGNDLRATVYDPVGDVVYAQFGTGVTVKSITSPFSGAASFSDITGDHVDSPSFSSFNWLVWGVGTNYTQSVAGTIGALTGAVSRFTSKFFSGTSGALTGAVTMMRALFLGGTVGSISGTLSRRTSKFMSGLLQFLGDMGILATYPPSNDITIGDCSAGGTTPVTVSVTHPDSIEYGFGAILGITVASNDTAVTTVPTGTIHLRAYTAQPGVVNLFPANVKYTLINGAVRFKNNPQSDPYCYAHFISAEADTVGLESLMGNVPYFYISVSYEGDTVFTCSSTTITIRNRNYGAHT